MIFVIRAGARPRNVVRKLLNKRNAANLDILLTHLAKALDIETGTIKRVYTIYGRPVDFRYFTLVITDADDSPVVGVKRSSASVWVCASVCASVCFRLQDSTKTEETTITKQ